ncbi:MAG: carbohydrate kinase [Gallionellales bacterium GWA2_55_18]|nr:MAG: carbohydrate kinase [Gallionellales bacterium GWA2_55_18]
MISAIALDLGTTSIKAGLLDQDGALGNIVAKPAPKIAVNGGCYESDALAYATVAEQVLGECLTQASDCRTLGLCSQRSSFLIWEQATGQPVTALISWQDNRGAASCEALRTQENLIRDLTGLPLAPYYFAPKLRVMLQANPEWLTRLEQGELLAGTLDTFLIWRWSGGQHFMTDASMAARTLLMDIRQQQWSPRLCELFGIPINMLPEIRPSAGLKLQLDNGLTGRAKMSPLMMQPAMPVSLSPTLSRKRARGQTNRYASFTLTLQASLGDQSAALIASVSEDRTEALVNLGTGCFVVRYLPDENLSTETPALDGYLRTLVYQDNAQHTHFAIEGTLNSIAAALAPYPADECQVDDLFLGDIFCLAEPSGLGAPYFQKNLGIRFSQPIEHLTQQQIAALLLEAVIFRVARILEDFHRASPIERVYLSGGLSGLSCLQHGIARCVPFDVYRLLQAETSLQGAALLAAGMAPAFHREVEKISAARSTHVPPEKYLRWKEWLDALLR